VEEADFLWRRWNFHSLLLFDVSGTSSLKIQRAHHPDLSPSNPSWISRCTHVKQTPCINVSPSSQGMQTQRLYQQLFSPIHTLEVGPLPCIPTHSLLDGLAIKPPTHYHYHHNHSNAFLSGGIKSLIKKTNQSYSVRVFLLVFRIVIVFVPHL
jgi:hypothetical protein